VAPPESWGEPAPFPISRAEQRARRLAARWVLPVDLPPIEHGALLVGPEGRIEVVGPDAQVPRPSHLPSLEFANSVLLPGLINTHTHLELTGLEGQVSEPEFPTWITHLRQIKNTRGPADYLAAARQGLQDCYAAGVTTVADTGDSGAVIQALAEADGSGIAYQEVFGPDPARLTESLSGLHARVEERSRWATGRVRLGVSPHAPYSVSGPLFQAVAAWAETERLPLAVHVAESPAETQFVQAGAGPFAQAWVARGIALPASRGRTPVEWLDQHGVLTERTLCIHAVQVTSQDVDRLANSGAAVAHCPLSNQAHGHGAAPLQAFLAAGVRVGLGTDSVVSVGRLDLLAEARLAQKRVGLSADQAVELCTLRAARALGLDDTGSLRPGKWADCTAIRLPPGEGTPSDRLLASSPDHVLLTCVAGREVYRAP
jgi:cytosine/adenosine deaminase-related metal-dependent hydrolase